MEMDPTKKLIVEINAAELTKDKIIANQIAQR
jgi:hypothetical protein